MKRILGRQTRSRPEILLKGLEFKLRDRVYKMSIPPRNQINKNVGNGINKDVLIEELRDEIIRLRQLNHVQNEQMLQFQNRAAKNATDANSQLVRSLIDGLRGLTVDVKIPKFCEPENLQQFFEKLEKYCIIKNIQENRFNVIDGCFEGRARFWFESQRNNIFNYNEFKTTFLAEFFSIPIRIR